jgi:hypothetical protein
VTEKEKELSVLTLASGAKIKSNECGLGFDSKKLIDRKLLAIRLDTQEVISHITHINDSPITDEQFDSYVSQWAQALLESPEHREDVARILKFLNYVATPIEKVEKVGKSPYVKNRKKRARNKIARKARKRQRKYK